MEEIWKDITGYEGFYKVSDIGRAKSLARKIIRDNGMKQTFKERILKAGLSGEYLSVVLYGLDKVKKSHYVHRLVAVEHVPNPDNLPEVNHLGKDENGVITRLDNRAISLEWVSVRDNSHHYWSTVPKSSKFVGVSFHNESNKWITSILLNKKRISIGAYDTEEEAHTAYVAKMTEQNIAIKYSDGICQK